MIFLAFNYMNYLVYIPTILFILGVVGAAITGFRRGLRKSIILLINMFIALGVSFLIFYLIFGKDFNHVSVQYTNLILGNFNTSLGKLLNTADYNSLNEYMTEFMATTLPTSFYTSASLGTIVGALMAVAEFAVRIVMLVVILVLYFIIKFILYIVYLIFFKQKRHQKKKEAIKNNYKKHRLLGMGIGTFRGLVVSILVFSFVGSLFFVLSGGKYSDSKEEVIINVDDKTYDITEYYDIINRYGTVGIGKILESVKTSENVPVYLLISDYLLKGNNVGDVPEGIDGSSFYGRKELAPMVGLIKDLAIEAFRYGANVSQLNNPNYLIELLSVKKDGVVFADKVDEIISSHNFGTYTLYLAQCFVKSYADAAIEQGSENFQTKIISTVFSGENKINPNEIITNNNVQLIFDMLIVVAKNYDVLSTISIKPSDTTETLALGIRPYSGDNGMLSDEQAEAVENVLLATEEMINSFDFMKNNKANALLSDISILCMNEFMPEYSLDGIDNKADTYSLYNIKWTNSISSVFDTIIDVVNYVNKNNIVDTNELISSLLKDLENTSSDGAKLLYNIIDNAVLGAFLNAQGLKDMISESFFDINLPQNIAYGSYFEGDTLVKGEISKLIQSLSTQAYRIYEIFTDETTSNTEKLGKIFDKNYGITEVISNTLDYAKPNTYSKLLHAMISDLLFNIENVGMTVQIYVPQSARYNDSNLEMTLVDSKELVVMLDLIGDIAPNIFVDKIDYSKLLTNENVDKMMESSILKSTLSITAYTEIVKMRNYKDLIPSSLALDTDQNIEVNLDKWVGNGEIKGELNYIIDALTDGDMLNRFFASESLSPNDLINIFLDMTEEAVISAMSSNVLNIIVTSELQNISLGETSIVVPKDAKMEEDLEGKDRLKPSEVVTLLNIVKDENVGFKDVINAPSEEQSSLMIEKVLNLGTEAKQNIVNSNILNATITSYLENISIPSSGKEYGIIVPKIATIPGKDASMLTYDEFSHALDTVRLILNGKTDFTQIKLSRILDEDVIQSISSSSVLSATIINLLIDMLNSSTNENINKNFAIPQAYQVSKDELINNYDLTRWVENNELFNLLNSIKLLGVTFTDTNDFIFDEAEMLKVAINASDENSRLMQILTSEILYSSLSKSISNIGVLDVINQVQTNLYEGTDLEPQIVIKKDEVVNLFAGVELIIGADELTAGVKFNELSGLLTIERMEQRGLLTAQALDKLLDSVIVETKITTLIVETGANTLCITDDLSYTTLEDENFFNWLSINKMGEVKADEGETKKIINALDKLGLITVISQPNTKFSLDSFINLTDTEIDSILESNTIYATLLNSFYNNDTISSVLTIPSNYSNIQTSDIKSNLRSLNIVKDKEIYKVIHAIKELGISLDNPTINVNLVLSLNDSAVSNPSMTKVDVVAESSIIWLTLSENIFAMGDLALPPKDDITDIERSVLTDGLEERYILSSEIASLATALETLGMKDDIKDFDINTILSPNLDITKLCDSIIIWFNLSDKISSFKALEIPTVIRRTISSADDDTGRYLEKEEIQNLRNALYSLNFTDFERFDFNSILSKGSDERLWTSTILRYNATKTILEEATVLKVSTSDVDLLSGQYIIKTSVMIDFMKAIEGLGLTNIGNINVDFNTVMDSVDALTSSSILRNTISYEMFKASQNASLLDIIELKSVNDEKLYQINKQELMNYFEASKILGLTSYSFDKDVNIKDKNAVLAFTKSNILRITYSSVIYFTISIYNAENPDNLVTLSTEQLTIVSYNKNNQKLETKIDRFVTNETVVAFANTFSN